MFVSCFVFKGSCSQWLAIAWMHLHKGYILSIQIIPPFLPQLKSTVSRGVQRFGELKILSVYHPNRCKFKAFFYSLVWCNLLLCLFSTSPPHKFSFYIFSPADTLNKPIVTRVAPDTDLAGYLAYIFAGYPARYPAKQ